jgi:hypothetical protein
VPVVLSINGKTRRVTIAEQPTKIEFDGKLESFKLDRNFYMSVKAEK